MNDEFDKKIMNLTMNLNIERSTRINKARIRRMKERNDCIDKVKEEAREHLLKVTVNPKNLTYQGTMKNLII